MTPLDLPAVVTYTEHVYPIMQQRCFSCHYYEPYNWTKYEVAYQYRDKIKMRVANFTMPPGGTITHQEREIIKKWVDDGGKK